MAIQQLTQTPVSLPKPRLTRFGYSYIPNHISTPSPPALPLAQQDDMQTKIDTVKAWLDTMGSATDLRTARQAYANIEYGIRPFATHLGFSTPTPRMIQTDMYTLAGDGFVSEAAKEFSAYQIALRRNMPPWAKEMGIDPNEFRYVFFGLQQLIQEHLAKPITHAEVDDMVAMLEKAKAGKGVVWNDQLLRHIVDDRQGVIPIKIEAPKDGSEVFPGEPVMQITTAPGYGEMAAWFECMLLRVWATTERATLMRYLLKYNTDMVKYCHPELDERQSVDMAKRLLADFSDRSSMSTQESEMLGLASATSDGIISAVGAVYRAHAEAGGTPAAKPAMYSLAHRIVQSYMDNHDQAYVAMFDFATKNGEPLASYVADCYDFRKDVKKYLLPLAEKAKELNHVICVRPDSGKNYIRDILYVLRLADKAGLSGKTTTERGKKLKTMTNLRVIYADGVNFEKMHEINTALLRAGFSPPDCIYYGIGGWLHDALSRSNVSAAMKMNAVSAEKLDVMKAPKDEPGKESPPGMLNLVRDPRLPHTVYQIDDETAAGQTAYYSWYDGIGDNADPVQYRESFKDVQTRTVYEFGDFPKPDDVFSPGIRERQQQLRDYYHYNGPNPFRAVEDLN